MEIQYFKTSLLQCYHNLFENEMKFKKITSLKNRSISNMYQVSTYKTFLSVFTIQNDVRRKKK